MLNQLICGLLFFSHTEALGSRYSQPTVGPIVQELYTSYSSPAMYELFPDAIQFLESVQKPRRSGELKVAALTNYDRRVHNIVKHLGLSSKLDFVMCSEDAKSSKPEPGIFLAALERANRDKSQGMSNKCHVSSVLRNESPSVLRSY